MARGRERVRLEDGLKLNLNSLLRQGYANPSGWRTRSIQWTYVATGEVRASGTLEFNLHLEECARVVVRLGSLTQVIWLKRQPRRFGGGQWYFVCPVTERCASTLWLPPGASRFASRQTWGRQVAYGSQFETWHDRALSQAQAIRHRLGGRDFVSLDSGKPPKPKGMRQKTYERLVAKSEGYEDQCDLRLVGFVQRLMQSGR